MTESSANWDPGSDYQQGKMLCLDVTQSLGDDTHAVVMVPKWAREHGFHSVVRSQVSVGGKSGPLIGARRRVRAEVNVRPQPFVKTTGVTQR